MKLRILGGLVAGLVAGIVLAIVMRILPVSAADGSQITMITYAARLLHAASRRVGWLAYIVYAIILGGLFGASLPVRRVRRLRASVLGGVWGVGWFLVSGFALVPALLGDRLGSSEAIHALGSIAVPLLVGHIIYGFILGAGLHIFVHALDRPGGSGRAQPGIRRAA
jgi:hypothetical protein